jgi:hypothetical protein
MEQQRSSEFRPRTNDIWLVNRPLAKGSEFPFVAATSGSTNLVAALVCPEDRSLYEYLTDLSCDRGLLRLNRLHRTSRIDPCATSEEHVVLSLRLRGDPIDGRGQGWEHSMSSTQGSIGLGPSSHISLSYGMSRTSIKRLPRTSDNLDGGE